MAGSKRRLTRASERLKNACVQADLPANSQNIDSKKNSDAETSGLSANNVELKPSANETEPSSSKTIRKSKKCQQKSPNSSKEKLLPQEYDTVLENMRLSKTDAHKSSTSENKSHCRTDRLDSDNENVNKAGSKRQRARGSEMQRTSDEVIVHKKKLCVQAGIPGTSQTTEPESTDDTETPTKTMSANDVGLKAITCKIKTFASKTSITNNTTCQQKDPSSFKDKRHTQGYKTEKENIKMLKPSAGKSSINKNKAKSKDSDFNNNKPLGIKYFPCSDHLKPKVSLFNINEDLELEPSRQSQCGNAGDVKSKNICSHYFNSALGKSFNHNSKPITRVMAEQLSDYHVTSFHKPFQCRITSIEWHPRKRNFLGVGSKHGDMIFYNVKNEDDSSLEELQKFPGIGPGGNISSMKFHPYLDNLVYTSSLCGKVSLYDVEGHNNDVFLDTMNWENWYSSLDVHKTEFLVAAGRNKGGTALLDRDGKCIWDKRLHRQKISHLEFSPREPNLLCTASLDHSVKLWDLRKVVEKTPLESLIHKKGLNSAYFSLTDGCRLLTTDQNDEIRIYSAPSWNLERTILHPHRFFQHLSPIKAYWHPFNDIIFCGRYPDKDCVQGIKSLRCIDILDASTGRRVGKMLDTDFQGIVSLSKMNNEGTKLVCSMGYGVNMWNADYYVLENASSPVHSKCDSLPFKIRH